MARDYERDRKMKSLAPHLGESLLYCLIRLDIIVVNFRNLVTPEG
jgi:hypothetical protein